MKKMTKLCSVLAATLSIASAAQAATPGTYVGIGLGGSTLNVPSASSPDLISTKKSTGGLGSRFFAGYNFDQHFGLEAGYSTYAGSKVSGNFDSNTSASIKYEYSALDLLGKAYLPVAATGFNVYALGGVALVNSKQVGKSTEDSSDNFSKTTRTLRPEVGLGASYAITPKLTSNLELSRIIGRGNLKTDETAIPNADRLTLGVSWNIG